MKVPFAQALVAGLVATAALLPTGAMASPKGHAGKHAPAKASSMKCPICKMEMPGKPTKGAPARVHVGSHYYYCCKACGYKGSAAPSKGKMGHMSGKMGHMSGKMGHMSHMGGKMSHKM